MSDAYHAAFFNMAKQILPSWLFKQVQDAAIPKSGGNARWTISGPTVFEKLAIPHLKPDKLRDLEDKDLSDIMRRLNQMFKGAKRAKQKTDSFVKAASWVVNEMKERKLTVDEKLAVIQEFVNKSGDEVEKTLDAEVANLFPRSQRGLNAAETFQAVDDLGRKFTQEESGFEERAKTPHRVCGSCRFFLRDPESEVGKCQIVEGEIPWFATSEYYINADAEAQASFANAEMQVHERLMDEVFGLEKSDSGPSDDDNNTDPKKPEVVITTKELVQKRIKRTSGGKYQVLSDESGRVLGTHDTKAAAIRQLGAIESEKKRREEREKSGHTDEEKKKKRPAGDVYNEAAIKEAIEKQITKRGNEYVVTDRNGKVMGRAKDRAGAVRLLAAVMAGKRKKKAEDTEKAQPTVSAVGLPRSPKRDPELDRELERYNKEDITLTDIPIAKIDRKLQKIYGIVLEPDETDTQDDTITKEEIEKAAEGFMRRSRTIGERHRKTAEGVALTDSYVTQGPTKLGKDVLKTGTWIIGVKVDDVGLWARIEAGEFNGFSVGGRGNRIKLS